MVDKHRGGLTFETTPGAGTTFYVRALKEFAHPDRGEKVPTEINNALLTILTMARSETHRVAEVETDFGVLPLVPAYPGDLNQVFLNLVVNAAHAIGDVGGAGGKGRIVVRTAREEDTVVISIGDSGTGIPDHVRDKIFDPFFTTKEVGRGTTFFVRLPLEPAEQVAA